MIAETTVFANDLKKEDFKVVSLHPGFVATDMGANASSLMSEMRPGEPLIMQHCELSLLEEEPVLSSWQPLCPEAARDICSLHHQSMCLARLCLLQLRCEVQLTIRYIRSEQTGCMFLTVLWNQRHRSRNAALCMAISPPSREANCSRP